MSAAQVYRAFDVSGRLLYVGCSVDADARLVQHSKQADWWVFVDRIEREDFSSRDDALAAEAGAIATEHPRWNMVGRSQDHPDGFAASVGRADWLAYERDVARRRRALIAEEATLLREIRRARMAIAGVNAEITAINGGLEIDENVA